MYRCADASEARSVGLTGLVGLFADLARTAATTDTNDRRLLVEPMNDGWWYSLVLRNSRTVAVYMTDADLHPKGSRALAQLWHDRFSESRATRSRARPPSKDQVIRIAPAHTQFSAPISRQNVLAVGDASMALDPLASVGIKKALDDGLSAANAIVAALDGCTQALERI